MQTLTGHTAGVYAVAFSPDSQSLASGSVDRTVRLWRVANGELLRVINAHADAVTGVAFAPNRQMLASVSLDDAEALERRQRRAARDV